MWLLARRGARLAVLAALVGALIFVGVDQGLLRLAFGPDFGPLWMEILGFVLLAGTAVVGCLPFAGIGGLLLGVSVARLRQRPLRVLVGACLGVSAMVCGFAIVYDAAVCLRAHGACFQHHLSVLRWSIVHDFASAGLYLYRLILATGLAALAGAWSAWYLERSARAAG